MAYGLLNMTFEERIDALTARHEALTMTVELITHDFRGFRKKKGRKVQGLEQVEKLHFDQRRNSYEQRRTCPQSPGIMSIGSSA